MAEDPRGGEFEIIERFFAPLARGEPGAFGLADDAAVLGLEPGQSLVVTTDTLVVGRHLPADAAPEDIAARLLRVNLSDLAAMAAEPRAYTLGLALPDDVGWPWLERFSRTLADEQAAFGITLIGGDTVATPGPTVVNAAAFGWVAEGRELRRAGARPGDSVFVSGTIGDGALGLKALQGALPALAPALSERLVSRYLRPEPRIALGRRLCRLAHAAADISDGLVADLGHICRASGVAATIEAGRVPLSEGAREALLAEPNLIAAVLAGGDDYELVFTAPPEEAEAIRALSSTLHGLPLTAVGAITAAGAEGPKVRVNDDRGREIALERTGYSHF